MTTARINELKELIKMKEDLEAQISALQDEIKAEMTEQNVDELKGKDYTITWKQVTSHRVDVTALKKAMPSVAKDFTVESTYRRFVIK